MCCLYFARLSQQIGKIMQKDQNNRRTVRTDSEMLTRFGAVKFSRKVFRKQAYNSIVVVRLRFNDSALTKHLEAVTVDVLVYNMTALLHNSLVETIIFIREQIQIMNLFIT